MCVIHYFGSKYFSSLNPKGDTHFDCLYKFPRLFQSSFVELKNRENYLNCSLPNRNFRPSQVEGVAWAGHWAGRALFAAATATKNQMFKFPAKWILEISRQKRGEALSEGAVWLGCHEDRCC